MSQKAEILQDAAHRGWTLTNSQPLATGLARGQERIEIRWALDEKVRSGERFTVAAGTERRNGSVSRTGRRDKRQTLLAWIEAGS